MFNGGNTPPGVIIGQVTQGLMTVRAGMAVAVELHKWSSGISVEDLTTPPPLGPGMGQYEAEQILAACADVNGLAELWNDGSTTQTFPPGYRFGDSARRVIGSRPS